MNKRNQIIEKTVHGIFFIFGSVTVGFVTVITVYLIVSGVPAIVEVGVTDFLFGMKWTPTSTQPEFGILPFILASVYGTFGAIMITLPVGIFTAVYLSRFADKSIREILEFIINLLSGIPSVVFGLMGMLVIVTKIRVTFNLPDGTGLLAAIIILAIIILPNIIKLTVSALDALPVEYEESAIALGATATEATFSILLPSAKRGIITAISLSIGRAIGESTAVIMVAGNAANMPSIFESVRFLTTAIAGEMAYSSPDSMHRSALFSVALILFILIMLINAIIALTTKNKREL